MIEPKELILLVLIAPTLTLPIIEQIENKNTVLEHTLAPLHAAARFLSHEMAPE